MENTILPPALTPVLTPGPLSIKDQTTPITNGKTPASTQQARPRMRRAAIKPKIIKDKIVKPKATRGKKDISTPTPNNEVVHVDSSIERDVVSDNKIPKERLVIYEMFSSACSKYAPWNAVKPDEQSSIIRRLERSCMIKVSAECKIEHIDRLWDNAKFVARYSAECARVIANIDITSSVGSTYTIANIISGEIDPKNIASMTNCDLCPGASEKEREYINLRKKQIIVRKTTDKHQCGKCGAREAEGMGEIQDRALDEPSKFKFRCIVCSHEWKEG